MAQKDLQLTVIATLENYDKVAEFVEGELEIREVPMAAQAQIGIALDEMYTNVAKYAYGDDPGEVTVRLDFTEGITEVKMTIMDCGIPYNPLQRPDPDVTLPADKRKIGGEFQNFLEIMIFAGLVDTQCRHARLEAEFAYLL